MIQKNLSSLAGYATYYSSPEYRSTPIGYARPLYNTRVWALHRQHFCSSFPNSEFPERLEVGGCDYVESDCPNVDMEY